LLEEIFREEVVQIIRSIPTHLAMDDVIGWHFDAKGIFYVKSVYKVQQAFEISGQRSLGRAGVGGSNGGLEFWKQIRRLECPPKVKTFFVENEPQ